jgi:hypothetical protein
MLADKALLSDAPSPIALRIDDAPAVSQTVRDPTWIRDQFMWGLGVKGGNPLPA